MADNVAITAGSGTTIAADDIGGVLHQRVKISQGADGVAADVSSAAPLQVTLANTGANATAVKVDGSSSTQPVSGTVTVQQSTASSLKVDLSGTAANGTAVKVDASSVAVPITDNSGSVTVDAPVGTPVFATVTPSTTGGWSVKTLVALSNTKTAVKAGAGTLGGYMFYNPNASVTYIQVFDVATGSITVGSTTPTYVIPLPATSGANVEFANGIKHSTEINVAATTTATNSTAPSTAIDGFMLYK
jgi:hypothetical protein